MDLDKGIMVSAIDGTGEWAMANLVITVTTLIIMVIATNEIGSSETMIAMAMGEVLDIIEIHEQIIYLEVVMMKITI